MPKEWYVLRVQSNREETVLKDLRKRVETQKLTEYVTDLRVPTEKVTEIKSGERRTVERKIYPGYVMIELNTAESGKIPDPVWFLIKETPGIGDFVGSREKPLPMSPDEVEKMKAQALKVEEEPQIKIEFQKGDAVKIKEGPFENFDGVIDEVYPTKGVVKVIVTIFGRPTPVELEYWQVESI